MNNSKKLSQRHRGTKERIIKIISSAEFGAYQKCLCNKSEDEPVTEVVREIIAKVRAEGDAAVRHYALQFEKYNTDKFEVPIEAAKEAWEKLESAEPDLASAIKFASGNIKRFAELQKEQFRDFETEIAPGVFTGQRVIPVSRAAVYVPAGNFPLLSSALMGLIPAAVAGVKEKILVSPPAEAGLPDRRILAAAFIAGADRVFAIGGAQAIAALAFGTETVPRADIIAGPGNKYVAAAKRLLFGEVGIDFVAGPTDVLIVSDDPNPDERAVNLIAADMLAQAEHDADARARVLVPDRQAAKKIKLALESRLSSLSTSKTARTSLEAGGLIIVYKTKEEAVRIANEIAPEHLELHVSSPNEWIPNLLNYGSLFIGAFAAEALGDYSAGINHTLPTSASARFTGGLSVRNFLKTVTSLRCVPGSKEQSSGYAEALKAAVTIANAEGLAGHAESASLRKQ